MGKTAAPADDPFLGANAYDPDQFDNGESTGILDRVIDRTVTQGATTFVSKQRIDLKRSIGEVAKQLMEEARIAGSAFYYSWTAGKDLIEGPSIELAMAAARCWGNCVIEPLPIQETTDAWIITTRFIDLETGYNVSRPFRQSKNWIVHGKLDAERKEDIRFQIGTSKSQRNLIRRVLPTWLINQAMLEAKKGVKEGLENAITKYGHATVVDRAIAALSGFGVTDKRVFAKFGVTEKKQLTIDHIVIIKGDVSALEAGQEFHDVLYPDPDNPTGAEKRVTAQDASEALRAPPAKPTTAAKPAEQAPKPAAAPAATKPAASAKAPAKTTAKAPRQFTLKDLLDQMERADGLDMIDALEAQAKPLAKTEDDQREIYFAAKEARKRFTVDEPEPEADDEPEDAAEDEQYEDSGEVDDDEPAPVEEDPLPSSTQTRPARGKVSPSMQEVVDAIGRIRIQADADEIKRNLPEDLTAAEREDALFNIDQKLKAIKMRQSR